MSVKMIAAKGALSGLLALVKRVKTRTWVILGMVMLLCFALMIWAAVALLGWLWSGTQNVLQQTGINSQTVEQAKVAAATTAEALMQQAREKVGSLPTLEDLGAQAKQQTTEVVAEVIPPEAELALATGAAVLAGSAAAALATGSEVREVSGSDIGPARFPGLIRTAFARSGDGIEVQYRGQADLGKVVTHYQQGFAALGFQNEVLRADAAQESHRYLNAGQSFELTVATEPAGMVLVKLRQQG